MMVKSGQYLHHYKFLMLEYWCLSLSDQQHQPLSHQLIFARLALLSLDLLHHPQAPKSKRLFYRQSSSQPC